MQRKNAKTLFSYNCKLHLVDRLFMYLHKIRVGSLDQDLADKFGVSRFTVSRNNISFTNFCIVYLVRRACGLPETR